MSLMAHISRAYTAVSWFLQYEVPNLRGVTTAHWMGYQNPAEYPQQFVAGIPFMHLGEERHSEENQLRHFALKDFSDILLTSKGENKAFPLPSPPCNFVPLFELPVVQKTTNTPTLNGGEGEQVWTLLFP